MIVKKVLTGIKLMGCLCYLVYLLRYKTQIKKYEKAATNTWIHFCNYYKYCK